MIETVLYAFAQSDRMGQFIVLLLFGVSTGAWCIMTQKFFSLREILKSCQQFRKVFENANYSPLAMANTLNQFDGPLKEMCSAGLEELKNILQRDGGGQWIAFRHCLLSRKLTPDEIDKVRSTMNRIMSSHFLQMEKHFSTLGTIVAMSPMLGLFGTVWGVMLTFIGIAQAGRPDLMAIAPGISGALLTTVAGLMVAIPSLVVNNYLVFTLQTIDVSMETFIEDFITSLRLEETKLPQESVQTKTFSEATTQGES
ncbi:MAG: MotA/TolQ/ExbB proton channel family protein [Lentisphaeria bacterium]